MAFNYQAAIQAGYSPDEINSYLAKQQPQVPGIAQAGIRIGGNVLGGMAGKTLGEEVGSGIGALIPGADMTGIPEAIGGNIGGFGGGAAGGGAGSAAAEGVINLLNEVLQNKPLDIAGPDYGKAFQEGAKAQIAGQGLAQGAGFLTHLAAPFANTAAGILERTPGVVKIQDLLSSWIPEMKNEFALNSMGVEGAPAVDNVASNARQTIDAIAGKNPNLTSPVTNLNLTDAKAVNSSLQNSVEKYYGQNVGNLPVNEKANVLARMNLAKNINDSVYTGAPLAGKMNKAASIGYQVNDFLPHLLSQVPGIGKLLGNYIVGGAGNAIQHTLPYGGGIWNQLLPGLFSTGINTQPTGINSQQQQQPTQGLQLQQ